MHYFRFLITILPAAFCVFFAGCGNSASPRVSANTTTTAASARPQETEPQTEEAPKKPAPAKNGEPEKISFNDLNCSMQADVVFRPWMLTERAQQLDGQKIRISGYILADAEIRGIKEFVLLKNTECKFGPGGQADHLILVKMAEGDVSYTSKPVDVTGLLEFKPFEGPDGNTWAIYEMQGEAVETLRR